MKKQKKKEYNSWFHVILYSLLEMFTSFSTDSVDYGGSSSSLVDSNSHLGELGKKRQKKLLGLLMFFFGTILLLFTIFCFKEQVSKIICSIITILLIVFSLIYLIKKK